MEVSSKLKVERTRNVTEHLVRTQGRYARRGVPFVIPASLQGTLKLYRRMVARYKMNDFRHTLEEAQAEEDFALWLCNKHRELQGSPILSEPTWRSPWLEGRKKKKLVV